MKKKISKLGGDTRLCPVSPPKNLLVAIAFKTYEEKTDIKFSRSYPILLDFLNFGKIFYHRVSIKPNLFSELISVSFKPQYLNILNNFEALFKLIMEI